MEIFNYRIFQKSRFLNGKGQKKAVLRKIVNVEEEYIPVNGCGAFFSGYKSIDTQTSLLGLSWASWRNLVNTGHLLWHDMGTEIIWGTVFNKQLSIVNMSAAEYLATWFYREIRKVELYIIDFSVWRHDNQHLDYNAQILLLPVVEL